MKLKRCPFCGGEAEISAKYHPKGDCTEKYVKCTICEAQSYGFLEEMYPAPGAEREARRAWNKRVTVFSKKKYIKQLLERYPFPCTGDNNGKQA